MVAIELSAYRIFQIEQNGNNMRLVIADGEHELACRTEKASKLKTFLRSSEPRLFKGRLQLHLSDDVVTVLLKGEVAGVVSILTLEQALSKMSI